MLTADRQMTVTALEINKAACSIRPSYPVLAGDWAKKAAFVATQHKGNPIAIDKDSPLAKEIRSLRR